MFPSLIETLSKFLYKIVIKCPAKHQSILPNSEFCKTLKMKELLGSEPR